eukprot:7576278-Alexandrium_andersonii.AAC.1
MCIRDRRSPAGSCPPASSHFSKSTESAIGESSTCSGMVHGAGVGVAAAAGDAVEAEAVVPSALRSSSVERL